MPLSFVYVQYLTPKEHKSQQIIYPARAFQKIVVPFNVDDPSRTNDEFKNSGLKPPPQLELIAATTQVVLWSACSAFEIECQRGFEFLHYTTLQYTQLNFG